MLTYFQLRMRQTEIEIILEVTDVESTVTS